MQCFNVPQSPVEGAFALCNNHGWTQVPATVFLNLESTVGSMDVIQGVRELGCCLRLDSLEAESEMGIFVHVV